MQIRNVLSLFDGMRCGAIALERAGITYDKYFSSEIDKYARKIGNKNYPNAIELGDVNNYDMWEFIDGFSWDSIDLLIGGSPCQDLSIAKQDRKGLDGERSGLFWTYVKILEKAKPKYFLLENVASMRDCDRDKISEILGVEPIMINSALMSAQQRKRYYWTNIWVTQPNDKKIFLRDIIEANQFKYGVNINEKYGLKGLCKKDGKSKSLTASMYKGYGNDGISLIAEPVPCALRTWPRKKTEGIPRVTRPEIKHDGKAHSLTSVDKDAMVMFQLPRGKNKGGIHTDKAPTMTANSWEYNNLLFDTPERIGNIGNSKSQGNRVYSVRGKSVSLSANGGGQGAKTGLYKIDLPDGDYIVRKLTPLECERLQTVPEGYTEGVSNTQRYKMLGNGWTVDVIAHILMGINLTNLV